MVFGILLRTLRNAHICIMGTTTFFFYVPLGSSDKAKNISNQYCVNVRQDWKVSAS